MRNILFKSKQLLLKFFMVLTITNFASSSAYASVDWIEETFTSLFSLFTSACDGLPRFNSFNTGSVEVSLDQADGELGRYISAANGLASGKMVKVQWNTTGIQSRPRKYLVVYRIDPRFSRPQTFILKYNYTTGRYDSDFNSYDGGTLTTYQVTANNSNDFATGVRARKYEDYFNYRGGRSPIMVDSGDVINIALVDTITSPTPLVNAWNSLNSLLTTAESDFASIHLLRSLPLNRVLYSGIANWCSYVSANASAFNGATCATSTVTGNQVFLGRQGSFRRILGAIDTRTNLPITPCGVGVSGPSPDPLCVYDKGRGMNISIGGTEIKSTYSPFFHTDITFPVSTPANSSRDFFYFKSTQRGPLDFNTTIPMDSLYADFPRLMTGWLTNPNHDPTFADASSYITSLEARTDIAMQYMHMGMYVMMINIGNSDSAANFQQQNDITVTYKVGPSAPAPTPSSGGITMTTQEHSSNAPTSGTLWIKVDSPHTEVTGNIRVSYAYYTGSTFLSNLLYGSIAQPVMNLMRTTAALFYQGIAVNPTWQLTVRILLTFYITMYSLYFLAGKVQVTAYDLFVRVAKLAVVFAMFDTNSWAFFNDRVFTIFLDGMSYLVYSVSGVTSSVDNVFGFVDIIFDKYTNPVIWKVLCVNLLQFYNGMTYVAILMIEAILGYLMAVIDVVIAYIMAFLTMTVLISLAPIFIVCMLFERTRSMFDNWTSLLFNYMIQPTVLLIFFLLMDQIISNQFSNTAMNVCWGWLVDFTFDLDLSLIGIPLRIRFDLPFLPGIPFFVPALALPMVDMPFVESNSALTKVVAAVLMFKIYAQISKGLIEYVTNLTAEITNVDPARKQGERQSATNPTTAIADQLKKPITVPAKAISKGAQQMYEAHKKGKKNPRARDSKDQMQDFTKEKPEMNSGEGKSKSTGLKGGDDSDA